MLNDLKNLQEEYPDAAITRRFCKKNAPQLEWGWEKYFGTWSSFQESAGIIQTRQAKRINTEISAYSATDGIVDYVRTEVHPYSDKFSFSKNERFVSIAVCSDLHCLDADKFTVDIFIDTIRRRQPNIICLNGDMIDLYWFSRFTKDPRHSSTEESMASFRAFLAKIRIACPNAQIDFILGNHEERFIKLLSDKCPQLLPLLGDVMGMRLKDVFGLDDYEVNLISKLDLDMWRPNKGNHSRNYKIYHECFVAVHEKKDLSFGLSGTNGHSHAPGLCSFKSAPMGAMTWNTTGCMCVTDAEYISANSKWVNGLGWAVIDTKKKSVAQESIIIPGDHVVIDGILYQRGKRWAQ